MRLKLILILCAGVLFSTCKKKEEKVPIVIHYKLGGIYSRYDKDPSTYYPEGIKTLNLTEDGRYCWTRVIDGLDSNFCQGTYLQTSDTSLIWNNEILINLKITPIDSVPNRMMLQLIYNGPPVAPLYGFYH